MLLIVQYQNIKNRTGKYDTGASQKELNLCSMNALYKLLRTFFDAVTRMTQVDGNINSIYLLKSGDSPIVTNSDNSFPVTKYRLYKNLLCRYAYP